MFGESDSESPRVGSPWDPFLMNSPSSMSSPSSNPETEVKTCLGEGPPKLVPEVEYGNVEYKLKLLNPSPERFTRLVTQMKWRLLEGGGQAYYELGVADSGQLVGLSRKDLEQSLETLEMMAGDIGASVIVVKEIEVPAALVGCGMNSALGIPQRTPVPTTTDGEMDLTTTTTETETSTTEDDDDLFSSIGLDTPPNCQPIAYRQTQFSHATLTLDADSMFHPDFEIEIASVYKPRPPRARPTPTVHSKYTKRGTAPKPKAKKPQQHARGLDTGFELRAADKRMKRDAQRDQRRRELLMPNPTDIIKAVAESHDFRVGMDQSHKRPQQSRQPTVPQVVALTHNDPGVDADEHTVVPDLPESRLIVEALVVRKLALEEAFLDFGGFALEM